MGILGRLKDTLRASANGLLDRRDPLAQLETMLLDFRAHMKTATAELVAYKADEKRLGQKSSELAASAMAWRQRAEQAVLAGDDDLARQALLEEQRVSADHAQIERERREMAAYAAELLKARRELEQRIKALELRKHTLAQELRTARGSSSVLAPEGQAWDALERADEIISQDAVMAELDAELRDPLAAADAVTEAKLREQMKAAQADQALAELKAKMGVRGD